ncbi:MAG: hypothetical protein V4724_04960 [Pseudomonadota bacterium]
MRKLFLLLAGLGALSACGVSQSSGGNGPAPRTSALYTLAPGQTVNLTPTSSLKLERVNDSRCKPGTVCVWKGYISYSFILTSNGAPASFVLAEDMPGGSNTVTQQGLRFTLDSAAAAEPPAPHGPAPTYRVSLRVEILTS